MPDQSGPIEYEQSYKEFLAVAQGLAKEAIVPFRADPIVVLNNLKRGATAVLERKTQLPAENLPPERWSDLESALRLTEGLVYAASQVNRLLKAEKETADVMKEVYLRRRQLLAFAVGLAEHGEFPEAEVENIQQGTGHIDAATDLMALGALYRKHAEALSGKTPFTLDEITQAAQIGSRALSLLKPSSLPKDPSVVKETQAAADIRDRFWTLVVRAHDRIWRVGAFFWGRDEVDTHVPPLQSTRRRKSVPIE